MPRALLACLLGFMLRLDGLHANRGEGLGLRRIGKRRLVHKCEWEATEGGTGPYVNGKAT